ncbi:Tll0287-like domain-containing protein [Pontibacter sp. JAM-7]|uniref:Tll0287-like domain-containing protein n=1 Tax=Pontibacter sp. JAM-7 TaxID=3366581 RepID=UPI003AF9480C
MKSTWFVGALCLSGVVMAEPQPVDMPTLQSEAKVLIQSLAANLSAELQQAISTGGLAAGLHVCNLKAQPLTHAVTEGSEWRVGRTSLKLRNPDNAPDSWELKVLQDFQIQAAAGADLMTLAYAEVLVEDDGRRVYRMMKAIPIGEKCLACHGSEVKQEVQNTLETLYPQDQARGFAVGDLRGAFSVRKTL